MNGAKLGKPKCCPRSPKSTTVNLFQVDPLVRTLLVERSCATQAQRIRVLPPYPQRLSQMVGSL